MVLKKGTSSLIQRTFGEAFVFTFVQSPGFQIWCYGGLMLKYLWTQKNGEPWQVTWTLYSQMWLNCNAPVLTTVCVYILNTCVVLVFAPPPPPPPPVIQKQQQTTTKNRNQKKKKHTHKDTHYSLLSFKLLWNWWKYPYKLQACASGECTP